MAKKLKPAKPSKDFPLTPHSNGKWCKKRHGKLHYFGAWDDPDAALAEYREWVDNGYRRIRRGTTALQDVCNHFLENKAEKRDAGEIGAATFNQYLTTCKGLVSQFGKRVPVEDLTAEDFTRYRKRLSTTRGMESVGNEINRVRMVFKFALVSGLIPAPVNFGENFKKPSNKAKRIARAKKNRERVRDFSRDEILTLLEHANDHVKAFILLGINCGLSNSDIGELPHTAIRGEWLDYPRVKTGVERHIPLWPETVASIEAATTIRTDERYVFVTRSGQPYWRVTTSIPDGDERQLAVNKRDSVGDEFDKLQTRLGIKKPGRGRYKLRHSLETIGSEARDQNALDAILGHADNSMGGVYRVRISDDRLQAVTDHVRNWLFDHTKKK